MLPVDLCLAGFGFVCLGISCCLFVVLFFEARSHCGAPTDLEFSNPLPQSPKCWTTDEHDQRLPRVLLGWSLLRFISCVWVFACACVRVRVCVRACMLVPHVNPVPSEVQKVVLDPLELELGKVVVNCSVGAGNRSGASA